MNTDNRRALKKFLLARESDIFIETEDFGTLKPIFKEIFGRDPKKE